MLFHHSIQIISRSSGRSIMSASAYRAGEKLKDEELNRTFNYCSKKDVIYTNIMLPENAPKEYKDRQTLWTEVQKIEKTKNAQMAREMNFALPTGLTEKEEIALVEKYVKENFVDKGMCADIAIHKPNKKEPNPHAHIMLTTRSMNDKGEWQAKSKYALTKNAKGEKIPIVDKTSGEQKKGKDGRKMWKSYKVDTVDWNNKENAEMWRKNWAKDMNEVLKQKGRTDRADHRSYQRQGLEIEPTEHMGHTAWAMEQKGIRTEKGNKNRNILTKRAEKAISMAEDLAEISSIEQEIAAVQKLTKQEEEMKAVAKTYNRNKAWLKDFENNSMLAKLSNMNTQEKAVKENKTLYAKYVALKTENEVIRAKYNLEEPEERTEVKEKQQQEHKTAKELTPTEKLMGITKAQNQEKPKVLTAIERLAEDAKTKAEEKTNPQKSKRKKPIIHKNKDYELERER